MCPIPESDTQGQKSDTCCKIKHSIPLTDSCLHVYFYFKYLIKVYSLDIDECDSK